MKYASLVRRASALLLAALLFLFPITSLAAEEEMGAAVGGPSASLDAAAAEGEASLPSEGEEPLPVSAAIADFFEENIAELLAGATFLITLFLSLVLKKRLIPSLLESLSSLLGKGRTALDAITERQSAEAERIDAMLSEIGALLADAHDAAVRAEEAAELIRKQEGGQEALEAVLASQAELLFSLLASANLPQYEKDRVAAVYARIADRVGAAYE